MICREKLKYQFRKWKYKLFPDHCACCGRKMYVTNFDIDYTFPNGKRLVVGNLAYNYETGVGICRDCIVEDLTYNEWSPRRRDYHFWTGQQCAITGKKTTSYRDVEIYPYVDMTFYTTAWNYDYISKEAVIECVKNGKIKTSMYELHDGKLVPVNHKMLAIDEEGNLL